MKLRQKIYLAGSFFDFRDKIINALKDKYDFADPREHRQHAIASLVEDDILSATSCPIFLGCFPKGRSRGTMTYAEAGASRTRGNYIITADETGEKDEFLEDIADKIFNSIDKAIEFLRHEKPETEFENRIIRKQDNSNKINLFLAADKEHFDDIDKIREDSKTIVHYNDLKHLEDFGGTDLTLVHLSKGPKIDRKKVFFMGMSYALEIPVILFQENSVPYPPLLGLARRVFSKKEPLLYYINNLRSKEHLDISFEAKIMYDIFKMFNK